MSLDRRLALYTALTVALVMGLVTVPQEILETRKMEAEIRGSLANSVLPLQAAIGDAENLTEVGSRFAAFHRAYLEGGRNRHYMVLKDGDGGMVAESGSMAGKSEKDWFRIEVPVSGPVFAGKPGRLEVHEERADFRRGVRARWRSWAVHMIATLAAILLILRITIRRLVTAPLDRLQTGIRKMEMGYWDEAEAVGGAWEIQWINWRFWTMGKELQKTVQQFLNAEQRASTVGLHLRGTMAGEAGEGAASEATFVPRAAGVNDPGRETFLLDKCRELESVSRRHPAAVILAREAIESLALEAEQLGNVSLKSRLEDAALRMLEPVTFRELEDKLSKFIQDRQPWFEACRRSFQEALDQKLIPVQNLECRIKHTGGVWRKMKAKNLTLDQVHDLFALRVVVPTETDCYGVLGVAHECFRPVVGRFKDYIATPKRNGYRSIHTCVRDQNGQVLEIQIRSIAMHYHAEFGQASHLEYKKRSLQRGHPDSAGSIL